MKRQTAQLKLGEIFESENVADSIGGCKAFYLSYINPCRIL